MGVTDVGGVPMVHTGGGFGDAGGWMGMLLVIALLGGGLGYGNRGHDGGWGNEALAFHDRAMQSNFLQRDMFDIEKSVLLQGERTQAAIAQSGFQTALGQRDILTTIQSCCCETNRNIDAVRFQAEQNTNRIENAICASTRGIIDHMNAERMRQDGLTIQRLELGNMEQRLIAAQLPPRAVPAYPAPNPFVPFAPAQGGWGGGCPHA